MQAMKPGALSGYGKSERYHHGHGSERTYNGANSSEQIIQLLLQQNNLKVDG